MTQHLPIELYRSILDHIDDTDTLTVRSLVLVNHFMHSEAEPLLYRTLIVSTSLSNVRHYLASFQKRIQHKPSLATNVARLHLLDYAPIYSGDDESDLEGLFDDLDDLLRLTPNLHSIVIEDLYGRPRTYRFLTHLSHTITSLVYETQAAQPHVHFGELLGALGNNFMLTRLDLHSRMGGEDGLELVEQSVWTPLPSPELDRLFRDVVSLGGDEVVICRLVPRCPRIRRVRWYTPNAFLLRGGFTTIIGSGSKLVKRLAGLEHLHVYSWTEPRRIEAVDKVIDAAATALARVDFGVSFMDALGRFKTISRRA